MIFLFIFFILWLEKLEKFRFLDDFWAPDAAYLNHGLMTTMSIEVENELGVFVGFKSDHWSCLNLCINLPVVHLNQGRIIVGTLVALDHIIVDLDRRQFEQARYQSNQSFGHFVKK